MTGFSSSTNYRCILAMLFTDVQRSVRLNKKKKSTNTSPYPDEVIDRLARAFYPAILACWNSEEGQREFAAWQAEQTHHTPSKEKQSVPDRKRPVVHIVIVCGLWQGASAGRTLFFYFVLNLLTRGSPPHSTEEYRSFFLKNKLPRRNLLKGPSGKLLKKKKNEG